jgi:hypothetical protein
MLRKILPWNGKVQRVAEDPALDIKVAEKRVLALTLRAGLIWNNTPFVHVWVNEQGIFCHHNSYSAGEQFFEFLCSIGVLLPERGAYRLAIRLDALPGYASFLINDGLEISRVIDALVCLGGEGWLKTTREPFEPNCYGDGADDAHFDTRQLMADLAVLGYAEKIDNFYQWTDRMEPHLKANLF